VAVGLIFLSGRGPAMTQGSPLARFPGAGARLQKAGPSKTALQAVPALLTAYIHQRTDSGLGTLKPVLG
jgi:hypothetical protein